MTYPKTRPARQNARTPKIIQIEFQYDIKNNEFSDSGFPQFFLRITATRKDVKLQISLTVKYLKVINRTLICPKPIINSYQHPEF
jgi:hypothetical protein